MGILGTLIERMGYVPVALYEQYVQLYADATQNAAASATAVEKLRQENIQLRRALADADKRVDALRGDIAVKLDRLSVVKPFMDDRSAFGVQVYVDYGMFERMMDEVSTRRYSIEYEEMFHSLFHSIRVKFDSLLSLGPRAWATKPIKPRSWDWAYETDRDQ